MSAPRLLSRRTLSVCLDCRRTLLRQHRQFSSTSGRAGATFQSYPLPSQPPSQPRNASVPDTSIARPVDSLPRVHETRPPANHPSGRASTPTTSIPEQVAQTSRYTFASPANSAAQAPAPSEAQQTPKPAAKPKSRLRTPRKAAMKLTPAAVDQLRALLNQPDPKLIKVGVRNRGCSGLAYHLEYVDKAGSFDETVEQDGVRVLIDSKALFSIIGSEMDWVEDKLSQRFVFRNPNIKEECGCGESFMV
ncbi:iron-sulfur assembly protein 1 [Podospora aff. communis PSN243]|uniref:Iron-sulfur assembly protein 1 n=1 Tax=Podospora aff. communis PSN243 TaxID=3040156 RepID=A0AAV9GAK6_9PEZI|nr:iron-sulfur assembly protein 1 [Podospora aff. communis PSN243]